MPKKLTTQEFVRKARAVHGSLYGYSKVVYVNNHTKVTIIDPEFGEWEQKPADHLSGKGNPNRATAARADKRRSSTEEFIEKARSVHGDLYDYSKVVYKGARTKVTIIDPEFGEWEQTPNNHLSGYGNPERSGNTKLTTENFIEKARSVHGDLYDYSKVVYKGARTKVTIIDPEFGEFEQTPSDHLSGSGNPTRGSLASVDKRRNSAEEFIKKARDVHGDLYDYSKVFYKGAHTKVTIIDPEFGEWEQTPANHLTGQGNSKRGTFSSADKRRSSTEEFVEKARAVHGDLYDYSKVVYVNSLTKVIIIDPEFGEFEQNPNNHINQKSGHPKRSNYTLGSLLYVIEVEQGLEHFAKVGITTVSAEKRFPMLSGAITTHYLNDFGDNVRSTEKAALDHIKSMGGMQPAKCLEGNGSTECFKPALVPDALKFLEEM